MNNFEESMGFDFKRLLKAFLISVALTIIMFLIFGVILYSTNVSDSITSKVVFVIGIISLTAGGIISASNAERSGFTRGAIVAAIYFIMVLIGSAIVNNGVVFNVRMIAMLLGYIAAGMFGGSIGINMGSKKKYKRR